MPYALDPLKLPLVLLPGLLCDHALWAPQIDFLSDICETWVAELTRDDTHRGDGGARPGRSAV